MKKDYVEILEPKQIAEHLGTTEQNIRRTYRTPDEKFAWYDVMQKGTFCVVNKITNKELVAINIFLKELRRKR